MDVDCPHTCEDNDKYDNHGCCDVTSSTRKLTEARPQTLSDIGRRHTIFCNRFAAKCRTNDNFCLAICRFRESRYL